MHKLKVHKKNNLDTIQLPFPIICYNTNGTANKNSSVMEVVKINMIIGNYQELIQLSVMNLGNHDLFLGYDWLQKHNPFINWRNFSISLQNYWQWCKKVYILKELKEVKEVKEKDTEEEIINKREKVLFVNLEEEA